MVDCRDGLSGSGAADGVTQGDSTSHLIGNIILDFEFTHASDGLSGKRLIQLDHVDV